VIFHPDVIALLTGSLLTGAMLIYAAFFALMILRRWDLASGSELQVSLERRTYLIATFMAFVCTFQMLSLFLFIKTADGLSVLFSGAMCAAGTLNLNGFGYPTLIMKLLTFVLAGLWLIVNHTDNQGYDYPLIRVKYRLLLATAPLLVIEAALQTGYFLSFQPNVITSCCGSLFGAEGNGAAATLNDLPVFPLLLALVVALALIVASGIYFIWYGRCGDLFAAFVIVLTEVVVQWGFFFAPKSHCDILFSTAARSIAQTVAAAPVFPLLTALAIAFALTLACGGYLLGYGRGGGLFAAFSTATLAWGCIALISAISVYIYALPTHHCPFCILHREYGYIGYILWGTLLCGGVAGLGVGALQPFRGIDSLTTALPAIQRRLTRTAMIFYGAFGGVTLWQIMISKLI